MNKLLIGFALTTLAACAAEESKRAELPRMATSQEMQIIRVLVARHRAGEEDFGRFSKQEVVRMPTWSRMLPLHVLRTDDLEQKHPSFIGFAVPLKTLVDYLQTGRPASLRDSTYLFQQVSKRDILLDSTAFEPGDLVTPHLYEQPEARRKVHGYWFYRFSQPIFSSDGNSAYMQVDDAGSRNSYRLAKQQGKWTIAHESSLWVE